MGEFSLKVKEELVLFFHEKRVKCGQLAIAVGTSMETIRRWLSFENGSLPPMCALHWLRENYGLDVNNLLDKKGE